MPIVIAIELGFLAFILAYGYMTLHRTEINWLRPLVQALQHPRGSWWKRVVLKPLALVAAATLYVEHHVNYYLAKAAAASLQGLTRFYNGVGAALHFTYKEFGDIAHDIADSVSVLIHHKIPTIVHKITAPIDARARAALRTAHRSISLIRELDHRMARLLHGIDRLLRDSVIPRIRHAERSLAHVITRDIPALRRRERALEREVYGDLRARIGRIEKALGLGIFAAVVYKILAKVAPWLFCRNVNKLGRVVCGLNPDTLNSLLALTLGTLVITDLRSLVQAAEAIEGEITGEIKNILNA